MSFYTIKNEKSEEYTMYINNHIKNISAAFNKYGRIFCKELDVGDYALHDLIVKHDASKYSHDEFFAYKQYFYPSEGDTPDKDEMNRGWLFHIHNNPHHWNYWVVVDESGITPIDMPNLYIAEMLLDWIAMSMHFKSDTKDFWEKHKDKMILTDTTRKNIERCLANL